MLCSLSPFSLHLPTWPPWQALGSSAKTQVHLLRAHWRPVLLCLHGIGCGQGDMSRSDTVSLPGESLEPVGMPPTRSRHSDQHPRSLSGGNTQHPRRWARSQSRTASSVTEATEILGVVTAHPMLSDTVLSLLQAPDDRVRLQRPSSPNLRDSAGSGRPGRSLPSKAG